MSAGGARKRESAPFAKARQLQAEVSLTVALREVERKIAGELHAYERRVITADEHYRLGAIPVATYTELQKQYLDVVDAILSTQAEALESRQQLQLLTGADLGDLPAAIKPTGK